jgi:hypothetical protein
MMLAQQDPRWRELSYLIGRVGLQRHATGSLLAARVSTLRDCAVTSKWRFAGAVQA